MMTQNLMKRVAVLTAAVAMLICTAAESGAVLGEAADSVAADGSAIGAVRKARTARSLYSVHELDSGAVRVREYVGTSGIVFAVTWGGPGNPDLSKLLGSYFGDYTGAAKRATKSHGRRSQTLRTDRVVVERWGHMRNMQGRAYVPMLVPAGVNVDEIR